MDDAEADKDALLWAVTFIWETGVRNPVAAAKAIIFTQMVERMTKPVEPPKEPPKKEGTASGK